MPSQILAPAPAQPTEAHVGKSGLTIFMTAPAMAPAVLIVPTLTVNGNPVAMTVGPISASRASYVRDRGGFYSFHVANPLRPTDVITLDAPPEWVAGDPGIVALAVRNCVGKVEYPIPDPKMQLGVVEGSLPLQARSLYCPVRNWAVRRLNWNPMTSLDADGNPTVPATATVLAQAWPNSLDGTMPSPSGPYTLLYDATDPATVLTLESGSGDYTCTPLLDRSGGGVAGKDTLRVFDFQPVSGRTNKVLIVRVRADHPQGTPSFANLRVYPPGNDPDPDPLAPEQSWMNQLAVGADYGPSVIRWVDSIASWAGASNVVAAVDLAQFYRYERKITATIASIRPPVMDGATVNTVYGPVPMTDLAFLNPGARWVGEVVTTEPHGFATGQVADIRFPATTITLGGVTVRVGNMSSVVWVTGPNTFLIQQYIGTLPSNAGRSAAVPDAEFTPTGGIATVILPPGVVLPVEFAAAACSRFRSCDFWLNIPLLASDDCVDEIAWRVLTNLSPGHRVIVEYSNECWNWGFFSTAYCASMSGLLNRAQSPSQFYVRRSAEVASRVKAVFAAAGRESDVLHALCWQWGNSASTFGYAAKMGIAADVVAGAPYMGLPSGWSAATVGWEPAAMCDLIRHYIKLDPGVRFDAQQQMAAVEAYRTAVGKPVFHYTYEGGIERWIPGNQPARTWDVIHHPDAYETDRTYLGAIQAAGVQTYIHYSHLAEVRSGSTWLLYSHQGQRPGRGDGSDGRPLNRMIGTSGVWQDNNSVRGQAWLDWQRDALLNR